MVRKEHRIIKYFGYGANASQDMMEAIIGRKPKGFVARVEDYNLWIQSWLEISPSVRKILRAHWNSDFRTYCISPQRGKSVNGHVWFVTQKELQLIRKWEFWYQPIKVSARGANVRFIKVETEMIRKPVSKGKIINKKRYRIFLNNKSQMLEIAIRVRDLSLAIL